MPGAGAVCEGVELVVGVSLDGAVVVDVALDGAAVVVTVLDGAVVVLELAALAIAAPPPPTAAVTASAVSKGLSFEGIFITSFGGLEHRIGQARLSGVGRR